MDNLPIETITASTIAPKETSTQTTSTDNPNIIYPFPVPFLKKPPKMSQASFQNSETLPPSIVIAPSQGQAPIDKQKKDDHEVLERYEEFELQDNSFSEKKIPKQGKILGLLIIFHDL